MGEFKPMVKMETTEPTVELKLKKGGSVAHKCMKKGGKAEHGHKPMQSKMDGGIMSALAGSPALVGGPAMPAGLARRPARPSLAQRRRAMVARPVKKGGEVESKGTHMSEMKKINAVEKELKSHEGKKASVAHKGYANGGIIKSESGKSTINTAERTTKTSGKTGDVKYGNGGGYKTGGVVLGNGGGYATGGVVLGQGGYKKGGATKKFASGGSVQDDGRAQKMPQGNKTPSTPVSISKLSGTFKKGGNVSSKALQAAFKKENAPAMKAAKADSNEVYSKYQKKTKQFKDGGYGTTSDYDESFQDPASQLAEMRRMKNLDAGEKYMAKEKARDKQSDLSDLFKGAVKKVKGMFSDEDAKKAKGGNVKKKLST